MNDLTSKYVLYFILVMGVCIFIPLEDYNIGTIKNLIVLFLVILTLIYEELIKKILSRKNDTGRKLYEFKENFSLFRVFGLLFIFALGIYNFYLSSNHIYE